LLRIALEKCTEDLNFLNTMYDKELLGRLNSVANATFKRITYTEGIEILEKAGHKFEFSCKMGY
jgi:asparaginyl-tRNA synthetase